MHASGIPDQQKRDTLITRLVYLSVVIITFLCFLPALRNELLVTWDDGSTIINNAPIKKLDLDMLMWAFTSFYCADWLPLTWISFAVDHAVWGLNPAGYHLTNIILHAFNAGMVYLLFLEMLKTRSTLNSIDHAGNTNFSPTRAVLCSSLAALLYAVHPLRVEAVVWATGRKDVLSLFFGLLAVHAYMKHVRSSAMVSSRSRNDHFYHTTPSYWQAVILYILSLFSKPMLVTLPLLLLVLDWYPLMRFSRDELKRLLFEKIPFAVCAVIVSVIIMNAHAEAIMPLSESDIVSRVLIAIKSTVTYLQFTVWPVGLSPFYLHPLKVTALTLEYGMPLVIFTMLTLCSALLIKRMPVLLSIWSLYLITLLPVLGFTQVSLTAMADRYTYVPGIPISLVCAFGLTALIDGHADTRRRRQFGGAVIVFLLLALIYVTERQIPFWKDDVSIWSRAIDVQPHFSGKMYFQRGLAFKERGDHQNALSDITEAISIATRKNNRIAMREAYAERARLMIVLHDLNGALDDFTRAIELNDSANRSLYYRERGYVYQEMGMLDLADKDFRLAGSTAGGR